MTASTPPCNHVGSLLLLRYLESALGEDIEPLGVAGELNESLYFFRAGNAFKALAAIKAILERIRLVSFSRAGWFCRAEGIWRPAWPVPEDPQCPLAVLFGLDRLLAALAESDKVLERLRAVTFDANNANL